jgi:hypothetical protein
MKLNMLSGAARALTLALLVGGALPALATPVMEMRIEDLLPMATYFKPSLKLNPNQQTLWQQVESKSHAIVRERESRRERLQQQARTALEGAKVELRDLAGPLDAEAAASSAEEKQLRELWLTMNDALDEHQRQLAVNLFAEQLTRVRDSSAPHATPRAGEEGARQHRGMGRGKGGAGSGMPGS